LHGLQHRPDLRRGSRLCMPCVLTSISRPHQSVREKSGAEKAESRTGGRGRRGHDGRVETVERRTYFLLAARGDETDDHPAQGSLPCLGLPGLTLHSNGCCWSCCPPRAADGICIVDCTLPCSRQPAAQACWVSLTESYLGLIIAATSQGTAWADEVDLYLHKSRSATE
jgi:hypothetical protein